MVRRKIPRLCVELVAAESGSKPRPGSGAGAGEACEAILDVLPAGSQRRLSSL